MSKGNYRIYCLSYGIYRLMIYYLFLFVDLYFDGDEFCINFIILLLNILMMDKYKKMIKNRICLILNIFFIVDIFLYWILVCNKIIYHSLINLILLI